MPLSSERDAVAAALGRIPSGAGILTAAHAGRRTGMLASWFQQASFDPPVITVAVRRGRPVQSLIEASSAFVLNVAAESCSTAWFKHFGRGFSPDEDAFAGWTVDDTEFGPALSEGASSLGCRVCGRLETGDHVVFAGQVTAALGDSARAPYVHIRRNGLSY